MKTRTNKTKNDFDCIKMKREIQAQNYEIIKDMTPEERLALLYTPKEQSIFKHIRND